ncbi:MAG: haloacid dehalogenase-like hydrolase [Vicinamibacteria bacterium]|nr:haloacid dehalogenase-like hydrolase [Vicinamibacteria bacterium]
MNDRLVLFDIDGTLLSAGLVFRNALSEALRECYGRTGPIDGFDFSGKTDPQIVRELMRKAGLGDEAIDARMSEALERYEKGLLPLLDDRSVRAKPGAVPLVRRLADDSRVSLGLLTGNIERCAHAKLAPLGLNDCFGVGAYGSDDEDRGRLPAIAVRRAFDATARRYVGKQVVIVGDSVADVRCGRGIGVRSVAVASGQTTRSSLANETPDAILDDFRDVQVSLRAILGE